MEHLVKHTLDYYNIYNTSPFELVFLYDLTNPEKELESCRRGDESIYFIFIQGSNEEGFIISTLGYGLPNAASPTVFEDRASAMNAA